MMFINVRVNLRFVICCSALVSCNKVGVDGWGALAITPLEFVFQTGIEPAVSPTRKAFKSFNQKLS